MESSYLVHFQILSEIEITKKGIQIPEGTVSGESFFCSFPQCNGFRADRIKPKSIVRLYLSSIEKKDSVIHAKCDFIRIFE